MDKPKIDITELEKYKIGPEQIISTYGKKYFIVKLKLLFSKFIRDFTS
jgi:hypothetical protein